MLLAAAGRDVRCCGECLQFVLGGGGEDIQVGAGVVVDGPPGHPAAEHRAQGGRLSAFRRAVSAAIWRSLRPGSGTPTGGGRSSARPGFRVPERVPVRGAARWTHRSARRGCRLILRGCAAARALGATWARIGDALGMTRQSAWERFSGVGSPATASARGKPHALPTHWRGTEPGSHHPTRRMRHNQLVGGFIVVEDGRAYAASDWATDATLRAISREISDPALRPGRWPGLGCGRPTVSPRSGQSLASSSDAWNCLAPPRRRLFPANDIHSSPYRILQRGETCRSITMPIPLPASKNNVGKLHKMITVLF